MTRPFDTRILIRISSDLRRELAAEAEADARPLAALARKILADYCAQRPKPSASIQGNTA
jgi:hypothetical protein